MNNTIIIPFNKEQAWSNLAWLPIIIIIYSLGFWMLYNIEVSLNTHIWLFWGFLGGFAYGLYIVSIRYIFIFLVLLSLCCFAPSVGFFIFKSVATLASFLMLFFGFVVIVGALYNIFQIKKDEPAVILSEKGMWIRHRGLIAWTDISACAPYAYKNNPIIMIGITLKDSTKFLKQFNFIGKSGLFWSKFFKYPHIIIEYNDIVLSYSKKFIK